MNLAQFDLFGSTFPSMISFLLTSFLFNLPKE